MKLCKTELLNSLQQMDCSLRLHSSTLVLPSICPSHGYSECSGTKIKWEKYRYRREKKFSNSLIKWFFFIIQGSAKLGRVVDRQRKWLLHFPNFCSIYKSLFYLEIQRLENNLRYRIYFQKNRKSIGYNSKLLPATCVLLFSHIFPILVDSFLKKNSIFLM